jgi:hypothetical protein
VTVNAILRERGIEAVGSTSKETTVLFLGPKGCGGDEGGCW